MFGGFKPGVWQLKSETDPRWNYQDRDYIGMLNIPEECVNKYFELKDQLGPPPEDLQWKYIQD